MAFTGSDLVLRMEQHIGKEDCEQCFECMIFRKPLPDVLDGFHMQNDLDIQMRQFRISEMTYIVDEAGKLRETATDIDDALTEVESYLATLKNLSLEVWSHVICECFRFLEVHSYVAHAGEDNHVIGNG